VSDEPAVRAGALEPAIAAELPGLRLAWCAFAAGGDPLRRSPPELRARLRALSDRHRGAQAIALRSRAIPHAYRVLFRHLGMEPDVRRIPVEALVVERLLLGAHPSSALLADALLAATVETEVGVWAVDAERVGDLGLAQRGGRIVVADADGRVAELFAPPDPDRAVTHATRELALYAIRAPGVPDIAVEEAFWVTWEILAGAP
jgi:DNA/RNA-binding domain of Phe-tRNA-synthetase-like protein